MTTSTKDLSPTLRAHLSGKNEGRVLGMMDAFGWCLRAVRELTWTIDDPPDHVVAVLKRAIEAEASRRHPDEWAREKERRKL